MCGRARCTLNAAQVAGACGLVDGDADFVRTVEMNRFRPSYNISPGTYLPVFTARSGEQELRTGVARGAVHCMKWGLVPSFTKKTEKPDYFKMFNARSESVKEKASFRRLIPHNRCLVAVEGFYEWKKDGSKKQPYYIHFKNGRPLVFAALYDSWETSEGELLYTFTILTTRSSSTLEWLHDRMPVIFGCKDTIDMWLSNSPPKLEAILTPYTDFDLAWYPVTSAMGKSSFDGPDCIKEIPLKSASQSQISKIFSKKSDDNNETGDRLEEESATEDAKEIVIKKKNVVSELRGIKRELDMGPGKPEISSSCCPSSSKKKLQAEGGRQSSLLSYFGRK